MRYFDLVIDNRSDRTDRLYTYSCPMQSVHVGSRVRVPFALGDRIRDAYVASEAAAPDRETAARLKTVDSVDPDVELNEEMMDTAGWMRTRYLCRYIDAIRLFVPPGSKAKRRTPRNPLAAAAAAEEARAPEELTQEQQAALAELQPLIEAGKHARFLLHGVTGSGKTEVYMRAAQEVVRRGRTVIILVPEISLTGQIVERFLGRFGPERMAVLHSRLTQGERYDQWQKIRSGGVDIVIGARSAVFAPLERIGLIVIDEEHESTYKSDMTPKYDAAEVALRRVQHGSNSGLLLLGSATPSVVTYHRARRGIYKLLRLTRRYNETPLPRVEIVDMREELKTGNVSPISGRLHERMEETLRAGKQVMLFLNRRGYSTFLSCRECGFVLKCPDCGLSLTYHKDRERAVCHYCGHSQRIPGTCPDCGSRCIRYFGTGTQRLQEAVEELFPEHVTDRLDLDTIRARGELNRKLGAFRRGETRILIGTQIIAKGLDFRNVGLVGIVAADVSLNIPDFRSPERTFQLITQAAGRAGRGEEEGEVVIQSYSPDSYAIRFAAAQDYEGFFEEEELLRSTLCYPPYSDLIRILFTSKEQEKAAEGAGEWHRKLQERLPEAERGNLFSPQEAYMSRIKDTYRYSMVIKCPAGRRREYTELLEQLREEDRNKKKKDYTAIVDINPYSFS